MCRYTTKAHEYGAYTVRDKYAGDILTFEFGSYLYHAQARDDAHRVAAALESAYNAGIERGAREQRDYDDFTSAVNANINDVGTAIKGGKSGYPCGNTSKQTEIQERWRAQVTQDMRDEIDHDDYNCVAGHDVPGQPCVMVYDNACFCDDDPAGQEHYHE